MLEVSSTDNIDILTGVTDSSLNEDHSLSHSSFIPAAEPEIGTILQYPITDVTNQNLHIIFQIAMKKIKNTVMIMMKLKSIHKLRTMKPASTCKSCLIEFIYI